jgi:hypothetical protein
MPPGFWVRWMARPCMLWTRSTDRMSTVSPVVPSAPLVSKCGVLPRVMRPAFCPVLSVIAAASTGRLPHAPWYQ